jgi:hypothetical protein
MTAYVPEYWGNPVCPATGWETAPFAKSRRVAASSRLAAIKARHEAAGGVWTDRAEWESQRKAAVEAWRASEARKAEERWREQRRGWEEACDAELLEALRALCHQGGGDGRLAVTPSVYAVLKAELAIVSSSAVLFASAATIAAKAHVCPDTVYKVNKALEGLGVLRRQQSGGLCTDDGSAAAGQTRSNVFYFSHQQLRRAIGVRCKGPSSFDIDPACAAAGRPDRRLHARNEAPVVRFGGRGASWHPYRNGFGFARKAPRNCGKPSDKPFRALIQIFICAAPGLKSALLYDNIPIKRQQAGQPYLSVLGEALNTPLQAAPTARPHPESPLDGSLDGASATLTVRGHLLEHLSAMPDDLSRSIVSTALSVALSPGIPAANRSDAANSFIAHQVLLYEAGLDGQERQRLA